MRSPPPSDDSNVVIGQVLGVRGYSGFVRIRILTALADRFEEGNHVYIGDRRYWISEVEYTTASHVMLRFLGVNTIEDAQLLQGSWLTIPTDDGQHLEADNYFHYQMIGLIVETEDGEVLGSIENIIETGSNDVYVVSGENGQILVPAIGQVVKDIDLEANRMLVTLMKGMR